MVDLEEVQRVVGGDADFAVQVIVTDVVVVVFIIVEVSFSVLGKTIVVVVDEVSSFDRSLSK